MSATVITGKANLDAVRGITAKMAMRIYLETNGRMVMTRTATPVNLMKIASTFTGKTYKRNQLAVAYQDMLAIFPDKPKAV